MKQSTRAAALAGALLAASACTSAPQTTSTTQPTAIALGTFLGLLPTIDVAVEGEAATMILDTGGGVTALTPNLASRIGCTPWGQITGFQLTGDKLTGQRCSNVALALGGQSLGARDVGVIDLSPLLRPVAPQIDGLFSLDALADTPFTLDLAAAQLTLETPQTLAARTANATEIPIRLTRQAGGASLTVMARVPTESGNLWMQLDAGSDAALQLAPSSAVALGLDPAQPNQQTTLTLTGTNGETISLPTNARIRDMIIDGNIGLPILRQWVMTFDLAAQRLWIAN